MDKVKQYAKSSDVTDDYIVSGNVAVMYDYGQGWILDIVNPANVGCSQHQMEIDNDITLADVIEWADGLDLDV